MSRALPRTHFHSSHLIRFLTDLAVVDAADSGNAFAEKLGQWVDYTSAIVLSGIHNAAAPPHPDAPVRSQSAARVAAADVFAAGRSALVESITRSCTPGTGKARIQLPQSPVDLPMDLVAGYAPYRRFLFAHQRDMDVNVPPLRAQVRETIAQASPALRQLAALDAALDGILLERESRLLATLPSLIEKRFRQLFKAHQQMLADTGQADNPALWPQAGGWLARFRSEMQALLLAELDLRLQPTLGLLETFNNRITQHQ